MKRFMYGVVMLASLTAAPARAQQDMSKQAGHDMSAMKDTAAGAPVRWRMPPMNMNMSMMPGMESSVPSVGPFLPKVANIAALTEAKPREVMQLKNGDTLDLKAMVVRRTINGRTLAMYGFNGQYPGPLIKVPQQATIYVRFDNQIDMPMSVHWHGIRLDNRSDGVPGITQKAVAPGEKFLYTVRLPDAGIYWYHPHHREDIQQDLGLYGNIMVASPDANYFAPVNREEVLILDDVLIDDAGLIPWGAEGPSHALMGRFGNVLLVNGEPGYRTNAKKGEVVRYYLTNASNTRIMNLAFGNARMKLVATDAGKYEHETWTKTIVIAPAERYVVDVRFDAAGPVAFTNSIQAIDHMLGEFYPHTDTLGIVSVDAAAPAQDYAAAFAKLRDNADAIGDIDRFRSAISRAPDRQIDLALRISNLPMPIMQLLSVDTMYSPPIEWNDAMPDMNWLASSRGLTWIMRDHATGKENGDIKWEFTQGDVVKIRIFNDPHTFHPMQHPIHLHGQRFLVVARDNMPVRNLAWKDTAIIPVGATVDFLVDLSNPGEWMLHCHISEHMHSGMMMSLTVKPSAAAGRAGS